MGIGEEEARSRFTASSWTRRRSPTAASPLGMDRLAMLLSGAESLAARIPFPGAKTGITRPARLPRRARQSARKAPRDLHRPANEGPRPGLIARPP